MIRVSIFSIFIFIMSMSLAFSQEIFSPVTDDNTCVVSGQVVSSRGGLKGASILLNNGYSAISDSNGEFSIDGIPSGRYNIEISKKGFKTAYGTVVAEKGKTKRILIKLSSLNENSSRTSSSKKKRNLEYTTMTIKVIPSKDLTGGFKNRGKLWYVSSIKVEGLDGEGKWSETYDKPYDRSDAKKELYCRDAILGKTYRIEIEWHSFKGTDTKTRYWHEKLECRDGVFSFDEPGGY